MPDTLPGWLWFAYYSLGSLGGIVFLVIAGPVIVEESVRILKKRRAK